MSDITSVSTTSSPDALFAAAASRVVAHMIKRRARRYLRYPIELEVLYPGLSRAEPSKLVAIAEHLADRDGRRDERWFGFGGEVGLINAKAALLVGRILRRFP